MDIPNMNQDPLDKNKQILEKQKEIRQRLDEIDQKLDQMKDGKVIRILRKSLIIIASIIAVFYLLLSIMTLNIGLGGIKWGDRIITLG